MWKYKKANTWLLVQSIYLYRWYSLIVLLLLLLLLSSLYWFVIPICGLSLIFCSFFEEYCLLSILICKAQVAYALLIQHQINLLIDLILLLSLQSGFCCVLGVSVFDARLAAKYWFCDLKVSPISSILFLYTYLRQPRRLSWIKCVHLRTTIATLSIQHITLYYHRYTIPLSLKQLKWRFRLFPGGASVEQSIFSNLFSSHLIAAHNLSANHS
jgi:hypothetical protein